VNKDPFGNLQDWKAVLDQLDDIETKGVLAEQVDILPRNH
jgi:hypothetical protein